MATDAVVPTPCHRYLCTLPGIRDCCSCEMRFCGEHSNLVRYADGSAPHRATTVDIHVVHLIIWHMDSICSSIHIIPDQCCAGSVGFYDLCDRCRRQLIESDTDPDTPEKKPMPPSKRRRTDTTQPTDGRWGWPILAGEMCRIIWPNLSHKSRRFVISWDPYPELHMYY